MRSIGSALLISACFLATPLAGAQVSDLSPDGTPYRRAVEGGGGIVPIDARTPLVDLIQRLEGDWELVMTGKAYWIGYTDDMYSIAAHKDAAIPLLLDLINNTNSLKAADGAVLTIHLIGIDGTTVGRFYEEFKSQAARDALLSLIGHEAVGDLAVDLLARDPWKEDVPFLVQQLQESKEPNLAIINALFRYDSDGLPFRQVIRERLDRIPVFFEDSNGRVAVGELTTELREKRNDNVDIINDMDRTPFVLQWGRGGRRILRRLEIESSVENLPEELAGRKLYDLLYECFRLSEDKSNESAYSGSRAAYFHYVERGQIIIVDAKVAKQRWLAHRWRASSDDGW